MQAEGGFRAQRSHCRLRRHGLHLLHMQPLKYDSEATYSTLSLLPIINSRVGFHHCGDSPSRRGKYGYDRNQSCRIVLVPLDRRGAAPARR